LVGKMKKDGDKTRQRRAMPKSDAAHAAEKAGRSKPERRSGIGAGTAMRGSGADQLSKSRQRTKSKSEGRQPKPAKAAALVFAKVMAGQSRGTKVVPSQGDELTAQMHAAIIRSSGAAIIGNTLDGIVASWNRGAEEIFGYTAAEMIGKSIHVIAAPDRPDEMEEILGRIRRGERVEYYETERRRKDGRIVQVSLTVSPIHDDSGRIVGASKIAHDIASVKGTEAQLKAKSDQLAELAHALGLAPAMVRTLDGKILVWGRGLEALYGWSAEEAVGRNSHEFLATEFPMPLPEIQAALLDTGEWQGELVHSHRDGHRVVVASQWALHRDGSGKPISVLKLDWDVTEAKRAKSMIAERDPRLRSILETAPDAIITIDERGIIQSFSDAAQKLFGYAAGEVIGRNVKMLMHSPHRENHDDYLARYLRTGENRIIGIGREVEAQRRDGTIFPMDLAVGEVRHGDTRIFTGFIRDLTARVKMEKDLRQAQKMEAIGQLTGGVAHDFNNLLTVISGNLEMLEGRLEDAENREILNEAQEASQLGADLAKRLLAFGRRQPLHPKPVDLNALVRNMVDLLRRSLGEMTGIETRLAEGLPTIMADPGQIENTLLNLAINARDAMPKGGRLVIESARAEIDRDYAAAYPDVVPGSYVTLSVTDTGIGMTPEVRQRAFEPFYTTKGPGAGSGLGLSMVYGFVKQSGGHVQLYSEIGHGTTVRLYLPARTEDARAAEQRGAPSVARAPSGETVLVVEDDERVRKVSVRRLKELGYSVMEADSGPAALKLLDTGRSIDVLFTDIIMTGGMTGVDLAQEARRHRPELTILFTSGYAEPAIIKGGLLTTNANWLGKPYSSNELDAKLRELLDRPVSPRVLSPSSPKRRRHSRRPEQS
jgi:PAS domain S-box-containing protein